MYADDRDKNSQ
jgi:hypothetical protein